MADKTWVMPDGIYTALVTPFTADGAVDRGAWRRLVQRQVDGGVAGVVPVGCTGEAAVLSRDEREWLVRSAVEVCAGRCAVVAGSGSNCTREFATSEEAEAAGYKPAGCCHPPGAKERVP